MILAKFIILRTTSPQPESLTFGKVMTLANYKALALSLSKIMLVTPHSIGSNRLRPIGYSANISIGCNRLARAIGQSAGDGRLGYAAGESIGLIESSNRGHSHGHSQPQYSHSTATAPQYSHSESMKINDKH